MVALMCRGLAPAIGATRRLRATACCFRDEWIVENSEQEYGESSQW